MICALGLWKTVASLERYGVDLTRLSSYHLSSNGADQNAYAAGVDAQRKTGQGKHYGIR